MSFIGFIYANFWWIGKAFLKLFKHLESDIKAADMKIYPEAYASLMGFVFLITLIINSFFSATLTALYLSGILSFLPSFLVILMPIISIAGIPLLLVVILAFIPSIAKYNRSTRLNLESPYLAAYISTMATGGVSPYISFERLAKAPEYLFKEIRKEAIKFFINVKALGKDPLTAIEESARDVPDRQYKELMLGYAATLRTGGDVVHYLYRQTEVMFRDRISQVRAIAERVGILMEAYMAIVVVLALSIYSIFIVNQALAQAMLPLMSGAEFFMFSYVLMPMISALFIYLADMMQPKYPTSDYRPYYVYFAVSLPITVILGILFTLPFFTQPMHPAFEPYKKFIEEVNSRLGLPQGFETGVGLSLAMIIGLIPAWLATEYLMKEYKGVEFGITRFLRDLVEVRKTGLSPEKCIINLSIRDYGKFSKHLELMAKKIGWGRPLSTIYEDFAKKVRSWLARITMFLLTESIEVGGGTSETLESLANFAEMIELVEKEKRRILKPLIIIPYIGSIITTLVVIILIAFMNNIMSIARMAIAVVSLTRTFLPPIVLNSYITGLTAGKISTEKVYGGFFHALLLVLTTLLTMAISPHIAQVLQFGG